ncbi:MULTISPECIES: chloride channel protein [Halomonadaceae]|uniref:Chloride channel protein n=1 Tax=Vreelandella piezotolerans TaxID=2609667 RepID=A0ABQ6X6X0_9GAMM|nr:MULTISPECIES: chloride channel protein [Halomonas]MCG7577306.1 chloride channel protein [Halomonas sp. MMH1-48]MCG7591667.1 chloride channel protein [Halomonas sp. McD50-5]MCG7604371.1 chloride channel protein [Halomonas sp. MM17-34]MCG7613620.1 chloride channel protein [Halomonas sp. MM17-29]MCG7617759.1 chloride channel protein [Halomonas sp. McD50-4]MCG7620394.1 chloride channel protein [Halomonas sp. DSH1-27]
MARFSRSDFTLESFRRQLANVDALPQLCVLGLVSGVITGAVMVAFRLLLEAGAALYMPDGDPEAFEGLTPWLRALLPIMAVTLIGLLLYRQRSTARKLGVSHVIERLTYHQGRFPLRNWLNQWWVGVVSVLGGLSAGREGPAIHLGAAASSGLGLKLRLPNNSLRVLVACGTAAGISASFNTPIAGVIFAMEVVMMEYTLMSFMPVILASTMGALVAQVMYGNEPAFRIPEVALGSLMNLPWIVVIGLVIGLMAGLFIHISRSQRLQTLPLWLRLGVVGVGTGVLAWWFPEIQGIGYDSVAAALNNQLAINVLLALMVAKLLITAITVAGGVPIGIIGPVLVAGAATGALGGMLGGWLWPEKAADPGIYAMLGMAAMMGAVLQAPLAALMALLELTHTPNIMLPGMLVVVVACLTSRQLTGCEGFFISSVRYGLHPLQQPLMQALSRVSVPAVMERRLVRTERMITPDQARRLLETNPMWLVIERSSDDKPVLALKAAELARWLLEHDEALNGEAPPEDELVDLLEIPGQRLEMAPIGLQATLSEAFLKLQDSALGALYVVHGYRPKQQRISGIITRGAIERYYHYTDARQPDVRDTDP